MTRPSPSLVGLALAAAIWPLAAPAQTAADLLLVCLDAVETRQPPDLSPATPSYSNGAVGDDHMTRAYEPLGDVKYFEFATMVLTYPDGPRPGTSCRIVLRPDDPAVETARAALLAAMADRYGPVAERPLGEDVTFEAAVCRPDGLPARLTLWRLSDDEMVMMLWDAVQETRGCP